MIDAADELLVDYEIRLAAVGGDPADHAAIERCRAELAEDRKRLIAKMRAVVARGGKGLQ